MQDYSGILLHAILATLDGFYREPITYIAKAMPQILLGLAQLEDYYPLHFCVLNCKMMICLQVDNELIHHNYGTQINNYESIRCPYNLFFFMLITVYAYYVTVTQTIVDCKHSNCFSISAKC